MDGFQQQPTASATTHPASKATALPAAGRTRSGRRAFVASALVMASLAAVVALATTLDRQTGPTEQLPSTAATLNATDVELVAALTYLVEEEKLAHDIYVLGESLYGTRVFSNIARSEVQHQESVRALLTTYGVTDPSANEPPGIFSDPALQALYDSLAARMTKSSAEAMQVGILIEQTDIADLEKALADQPPSDVATVLTRLKAASENHLQAFLRAASRG
jgi:hypothetical protein